MGQGGQSSAQGRLGAGRAEFSAGDSLAQPFQILPVPTPGPPGVTSLQCHDLPGASLFYIIVFMDLFTYGEIFLERAFLEEGPEPGGQEEEAGPGVGDDHRPSQKGLMLQGEAKHPKILLFPGR